MSTSPQTNLLKQGMIWGALYWLIHMSLLSPLFLLTVWFASIPATMLYVKTNRAVCGGVIAAALVIGAAAAGSAAAAWLMIAFFFLVPSIAMGEVYRRRQSAKKALTAGTVSYVAMFLLLIVLATISGFNLNRAIGDAIRDGVQTLPSSLQGVVNGDAVRELIELTTMMVPFYLIGCSFLLAAVAHTVSRRIGNRTGSTIAGLPPIREWKLPRSLVWYYLIALIADLFIPKEQSSFVATVVVNLVPLFMLVFAVQGLAFLFFVAYEKRKSWIPWVGIAVFVFFPPLFSAFSLLGVFDTAFPIRDRFRKS